MEDRFVLIVGAGPTGMTMAIELKRLGFDVRIIDKSSHQALHSQALVVQARTLEQLQRYGLAEKAVAQGKKLSRAKFWSEGKLLVSFVLDQIPGRYPYVLFLPQNETESILNAEMERLGVKVEREMTLVSLARESDTPTAVIRAASGQEERIRPRWIIGCDGAHSSVREQMGIPFDGGGIGLSFFLGDLEIEGPDAPTEELAIHLHKGDVVFMGRLTDKWTRLIVALHAKQEEGQQRVLMIQDFQDAVDAAGIRLKIKSADWMTPFRVNDRQAKRYRVGNVFLAGDASHIHSPVGGQGMNTGIQDVANLAWKLAAVSRGAKDSLLDSYEEERGAVGRALLKSTERALKMATTANPVLEGIRDTLIPALTSLHPMQKAIAGFISETAIEYRSSSIVSDHGGSGTLRAGDRMPDIPVQTERGPATLLRDWTDAQHLVLMLNASEQEAVAVRAEIGNAGFIRIDDSALEDEGRKLVGSGSRLFIIRPDGYIGFRGPVANQAEWRRYAQQDGLESVTGAAERKGLALAGLKLNQS